MPQVNICTEVTGTVWKIATQTGVVIEPGAPVMLIESMKMEIPITSAVRGTVAQLLVQEGDVVSEGQAVATIAT